MEQILDSFPTYAQLFHNYTCNKLDVDSLPSSESIKDDSFPTTKQGIIEFINSRGGNGLSSFVDGTIDKIVSPTISNCFKIIIDAEEKGNATMVGSIYPYGVSYESPQELLEATIKYLRTNVKGFISPKFAEEADFKNDSNIVFFRNQKGEIIKLMREGGEGRKHRSSHGPISEYFYDKEKGFVFYRVSSNSYYSYFNPKDPNIWEIKVQDEVEVIRILDALSERTTVIGLIKEKIELILTKIPYDTPISKGYSLLLEEIKKQLEINDKEKTKQE